MSKRIYTFEVEIDDAGIHETETYEDGTCDHPASISCEDSVARELDDLGRAMARKAGTSSLRTIGDSHAVKKATFIESYSEDEWDDLIHDIPPVRRGPI